MSSTLYQNKKKSMAHIKALQGQVSELNEALSVKEKSPSIHALTTNEQPRQNQSTNHIQHLKRK